MKTSPAKSVLRAVSTLVAGIGVVLSAAFLYKALTYHEEVILSFSDRAELEALVVWTYGSAPRPGSSVLHHGVR